MNIDIYSFFLHKYFHYENNLLYSFKQHFRATLPLITIVVWNNYCWNGYQTMTQMPSVPILTSTDGFELLFKFSDPRNSSSYKSEKNTNFSSSFSKWNTTVIYVPTRTVDFLFLFLFFSFFWINVLLFCGLDNSVTRYSARTICYGLCKIKNNSAWWEISAVSFFSLLLPVVVIGYHSVIAGVVVSSFGSVFWINRNSTFYF